MERAVCPEREVLSACGDVRWDLGRADLLTLAGVVLRAVVEERALREYLDDLERDEQHVDRIRVRHDARCRDERARRALDLFLETARELVGRLEAGSTLDQLLRLLALAGGDLGIPGHERERIEQHDLEAARVQT